MDNLTHSLVGLVASKAGLEKLSPGTTTLCILAANAPDIDIVALLGGRWAFLHHHRGITHSIAGTITLALALPLIFYLGDALRSKFSRATRRVTLSGLVIASLLATATHPLMDWTNNYGVRLLLPWNPRWFYGDFIFIVDPFIWLILGGAAFLLTSKTWKHITVWVVISLVPSYLVLVGPGSARFAGEATLRLLWIVALIVLVTLYRRKIGGRLGARIAVAALATVTIYCAALAGVHAVALGRARVEATGLANRNTEKFMKVAAMPTVANPSQWVCLTETDRATYRFNLSLLPGRNGITELVRYEKPELSNEVIAQAAHDSRAEIFLGFARFPVVRALGEDCLTQTLVQFADLRYTEPGQGRGTFSLEVPVDCPKDPTSKANEQH